MIQYCLGQSAYGIDELSIVLKNLIESNPVPVLFMRTLIQSLLVYPRLTNFAMEILEM